MNELTREEQIEYLKRECEKLQPPIQYQFLAIEKMLDKFMIGSGETLEKLQQENEELKKKNTELLNLANNGGALLVAESAKNKKYKQALEEIKTYINQECENKQCPQTCANCFIGNVLIKVNEVLNE